MNTLAELASSLQSKNTSIRGRPFTLRALRESEAAAVGRAFPMPDAPMMKNPSAGSLAPPIPNTSDPEYQRTWQAWNRRRHAMLVGLAGGWLPEFDPKASTEALQSMLNKLADDVGEAMTTYEIARLWDELESIFDESAQLKARRALIIDAGEVPADLKPPEEVLPEKYLTTRMYWVLTVCARYSIDPRTISDMDPGLLEILIQDAIVRETEKARRDR